MKHVGKQFTAKKINLDGNQYDGCTFLECELVFSGGKVGLAKCTFNKCNFILAGAAIETLRFMSGLYRDGAESIVDGWFTDVRTGTSN